MQVTLHLDGRTESGGAALIMHNERLADPLDPIVQALAGMTSKRKKTLDDHREIARLEFLGGLYCTPAVEYPLNGNRPIPALPAWNVLRCLQDGGRRHKRGVDVPRGIHPLSDFAELKYEGPTDPSELWDDGGFALRKSVGVQRSRTMRTRPMFTDWRASLSVEIDQQIFDLHTVEVIWKDAGTYAGLGDMRPVYGKFVGTISTGSAKAKAGAQR